MIMNVLVFNCYLISIKTMCQNCDPPGTNVLGLWTLAMTLAAEGRSDNNEKVMYKTLQYRYSRVSRCDK